ncbi:MAG: PQQ-dependent sugar dehydrogenase [Bacteroidia bacterium]|nr:PQQ-dependent sugar dehydrogenase [Bacteroidia bacterium]
MKFLRLILWTLMLVSLGRLSAQTEDPYRDLYTEHCAACHGKNMEGSAHASRLLGAQLRHGEKLEDLKRGIGKGYLDKGMPAYQEMLSEGEISGIAIYISEKRKSFSMNDYKIKKKLQIPTKTFESEKLNFRLKTMIKDLDPWPYSIAPLPDGGFLLSEKMRGLSIISPEMKQSQLIEGLPEFSSQDEAEKDSLGLVYGLGYILDVALHPDYKENGWVYISYGDRCKKCNNLSRYYYDGYVSMLRIIRGRIEDHRWVDQEVIWEVKKEFYTPMAETTLGGRLTFDGKGYLYFSLGAKLYLPHNPSTVESFNGIQSLKQPYGKIYRIQEDGRVPRDNPFVGTKDAIESIWTIGHRSPQGLEYDQQTNSLWGTEMGPRGGDEVNYLQKGLNYGWPLVSQGVNYTGTKVEFGKLMKMNPDEMELEEPVVDLTPSPAVSSFAICRSDKYPFWEGNLIVGSLKATQLYRMEVQEGKLIQQELLLDELARIRDVEMGFDGYLYLLLEHVNGGQILRVEAVE